MHRRDVLAGLGTAGLAATAGCIDRIPVAGSLLGSGCGPGPVAVESIRDGGHAGERVTITGKYDYTLVVGGGGVTGFRLDDTTGTIAVFLRNPPDRDLNFGECLTVEGTVRPGDDRPETDGAVVEDAVLA